MILLVDRFWSKVDKDGPLPESRPALGPCWLWTGGTDGRGYGHFHVSTPSGPRKVKAHRLAYELVVGPIPDGLEPDHLCRRTICVRPGHLEAVTHALNIARAPHSAITIRREVTHCSEGHELEELWGQRRCPTCRREQNRQANKRYRARQVSACF